MTRRAADALSLTLAELVNGNLRAGQWRVLMVAGGHAVESFAPGLEMHALPVSAQTVVIVCERKDKA